MTSYEMSPAHGAGAKLTPAEERICFALIVVNVVYLAGSYVQGLWLKYGGGPTDFVTIWAAGRMALAGHAAAAYDWPSLKVIDESAVGPFDGYLGWPYPPTFLFAAAGLALMPYVSAFALWVFGTFLAYLAAIRGIIGDRIGYFVAAAFPAVLGNFLVGQTAFLSAALIGGTLSLMERQPICAGVLLGLLTYKPHLGLLFPIALIAVGRWRVFVTAGIVAVLMVAVSWIVFGGESWQAFANGIGHALVSDGSADWGKLQNTFGFVRALGGSYTAAWAVQIAVAIIAAAVIAMLWRSDAAYEIKAAALGTGALLATPHLLTYDLVVLAVPLAFLFRLGRKHGFLPYEMAGMGLTCLLILIYPFVQAPVGFAAIAVVAVLVANRAAARSGRAGSMLKVS